jgi:MFS family permease
MAGLAPLRHRPFRLLVGGQLASNLGDAIYAVALPWYVLATHGGPILLATVLAFYGVPRTALVIVGGHLSDRFRPWTVMMWADGARMVAAAVLAAVAVSTRPDAAFLIPIAVVLGAGEGLFLPCSFTIVPSPLPGDQLQAGNAIATGATQLPLLVGPALGGLIVGVFDPAAGFGIDALSFAMSAVTLLGIRAIERVPAGEPDAHPAREGQSDSVWAVIRRERVLQLILVINAVANLGSGGLEQVALPSLVRNSWHGAAGGFGLLLAAIGGGALIGTLTAGAVRTPRRPAVVASLAFGAEGLFVAVVHAFGPAPFFPLAGRAVTVAVLGALT